ncbi:TonB-dependent receptor [Ideonella sp. BN130291]|uniref:TonB-dependent receptor n=1 Tax=Ideonella sp. BN130291 TaxID=3112940 RepID=UPI002E253E4D|nr:TonB-dependent receptor [Ideonella sp. BN130291]
MSVCSPAGRRQRERHAFTATRIAAAVGLLITGAGNAVGQQATDAPAPAATDAAQVERVVVTGIRRSLDTSLSLKRDAQGVVDGIVAEDIGKFPDTNLAESMQRISGVSIDRQNGEGSRVTVRGVGPDFNLILLNGRQMPTAAIEGTAASNSRAFDFANLASESIAALEVYKTSRASTPTGGMGATINIKTARPFDNPGLQASFGVKGMYDQSNARLPEQLRGDKVTPEISGIYSNTFADKTFGIALSGSYQERQLGYSQGGISGWRAFRGDENNWGTIPQEGQPGSENITNRPGPNDIYAVPQSIAYSVTAVQRTRINGQLTLQYAPTRDVTATLDYTYSENKLETRRNDMSAWFNFGPSSSSWTNGPVASPIFYSETITPNPETGRLSDLAMGAGRFATRNKNDSVGLNVTWKPSDRLSFDFDAHKSTATSGPDSPYGSDAVLGAASFNRGTTRADFSHDLPVLSIQGAVADPALMELTGSSFRNSYMKSEIEQGQFRGKYKLGDASRLDFGLSLTDARNRSAYGFVQRDTWGGATDAQGNVIGPGPFPDSMWHPDQINRYLGRIDGSGDPALFNNFFIWDFDTARGIVASASGLGNLYQAPSAYTVDRRVKEKSQSAFLQYSTDWELGVPMGLGVGLRYERTKVTSSALVPTPTGVNWVGTNEFQVVFGEPAFTTLNGTYNYWLPSIDFDADLTDKLKFRASYGETIGRPAWNYIQGGQTLDQLVRVGGGTGAQGNPGLKPLKSKNIDLSLEWYYAKSSYAAVGYFAKNISNYAGFNAATASPFSITTPAGGAMFQQAVTAGGCPQSDLACIRSYIFANFNGVGGVNAATGVIPGQPGDPVATFQITTPVNQRSARLYGVELNLQHLFAGSGFGVAANYTYVNSGLKFNNAGLGEQFALVGLSDTANLVAFYEDDRFNVRVAYNWRDQFLASTTDGLGLPNPTYVEAYSQLDMSMGYKLTQNLSLQFEAINLLDATQRTHGRSEQMVLQNTQTGRRFMVGARYTF